MKTSIVSIAEGKKSFSHLIKDTHNKKNEVIITKRGKPMAVIIPYDEYKQSKRIDGYNKIISAREAFTKTKLKADEIYKESKKQLEMKLCKE
ncbi:MAG: type II toxin-antitoxin system Phd/YefM family antitoxin [Candidatus Firestonebacteria bacterium]|nr:type II toxin-antitoxin system Phd/YefM family antitoxin [Candidatus Firestonebacteria bacterium]